MQLHNYILLYLTMYRDTFLRDLFAILTILKKRKHVL
jgi:hypothetical protein